MKINLYLSFLLALGLELSASASNKPFGHELAYFCSVSTSGLGLSEVEAEDLKNWESLNVPEEMELEGLEEDDVELSDEALLDDALFGGLSTEHLESLKVGVRKHAPIICAPLATFISSAVTYPLDLTKLRRQAGAQQHGHLFKGFGGYSAAVCTAVGVNLATYDLCKKEGLSPAASGFVSGFFSSVTSNPLWVYRTNKSLGKHYTLRHFFRELMKKPSLAFRGQGMNFLYMAPNSLYFHVFEKLDQKMREASGENDYGHAVDIVAGGASKILISIPAYPIDTIRAIRQKTGWSYNEIWKDLRKQGIGRLWRGFGYATATVPISTGACMGLYKCFKTQVGYEE